MANIFLVVFPDNFPKAESAKLLQQVESRSFMILPSLTNEYQFEFMTKSDNYTIDSVRKKFSIPLACKIVDTSNWDHS